MDSRTVPPATRSARDAAAKAVSVAKARFTVPAGKRRSVKLKLNARGKALLRKRRSMRITTTVDVGDPTGNTRRFTAKTTLKKGKLR